MISTSMINATPKKNAMPRTPASLPRFSNCFVVQAVGGETEQKEERCDQQPRQQRVDLKAIVEEEHSIGRQYQKGRMGDVGNVEQAEGDRQPKAYGRIEAAEQHADHHRIEQQIK